MNVPNEKDLLTPIEQRFPGHYKEYYSTKRNNFFASIQAYPDLWDAYMLLDKIVIREFEDMQKATNIYKGFALILFVNSHAKMRIAMELGLSACLGEAHSIIRDSIESFAHGFRVQDGRLLDIWLRRNDGPSEKKAYEKEFWDNKSTGLFKGLDQLYALWRQYSEIGSHTNITSVSERFEHHETPTDVQWRLVYTGSKPEVIEASLVGMLLVFSIMEEKLFGVYEDRLKLDDVLHKIRQQFRGQKQSIVQRRGKVLATKVP